MVPQQVPHGGKIADRTGATVEAEFRIYAAQEGGEPLWTETQQVTVAQDGSYTVLLGGASPSGLPQAVFAVGAARWLGVSVDRGQELERVLLSSVPYAMKSADAESLAGHAAADFVTQAQLAALAGQRTAVPAPDVQPETSGAVTGSGTNGTVPLWTGALMGLPPYSVDHFGSRVHTRVRKMPPATILEGVLCASTIVVAISSPFSIFAPVMTKSSNAVVCVVPTVRTRVITPVPSQFTV